jgi:hypothetical protein
MTCSQCGNNVADGSTFCPQCGAQLSTAAAAGTGTPGTAPPGPAAGSPGGTPSSAFSSSYTGPPGYASSNPPGSAPPGSAPSGPPPTPRSGGGTSQFQFDAKRWAQAERITLAGTAVLFISLFLPWFTYNYGLGSISVDGLWHGWMYITLIVSLAVILYLVARAGFSEMPFKLPATDAQLLLGATSLNLVLTVLAFVFKPGGLGFSGIGWGFGAFLGLAAALVAAAPQAIPAIQARRH